MQGSEPEDDGIPLRVIGAVAFLAAFVVFSVSVLQCQAAKPLPDLDDVRTDGSDGQVICGQDEPLTLAAASATLAALMFWAVTLYVEDPPPDRIDPEEVPPFPRRYTLGGAGALLAGLGLIVVGILAEMPLVLLAGLALAVVTATVVRGLARLHVDRYPARPPEFTAVKMAPTVLVLGVGVVFLAGKALDPAGSLLPDPLPAIVLWSSGVAGIAVIFHV